MKKPIFRVITVLLLLCFSISALLYLFFDVAQYSYKLAAERNISNKEYLYTIKIPAKELKDIKDDKEVWVGGKLYDVSSYVIINDTAIVSVFHDEDEEGVIKNIVSSFEPDDKYCSDNIVHISKHKIHVPDYGKILVAPYTISFSEAKKNHYPATCITGNPPRVSIAIIKPPPRLG